MVNGDSKSVAGTWDYAFQDLAQAATGNRWTLVANLATGGDDVYEANATLDAELAAVGGTLEPEIIMINFGANDCKAAQDEVTWKAALATQIETYHAKWANALVYVMRPWRRDEVVTGLDDFATWIAAVVAGYEYASVGPDERDFLENGDDGATYTVDGTHPNAAGYALTANEWLAVVGL